MTAEVVNLRRLRKARLRQDQDIAAAANRVKHGRTQAERERQTSEAERADKLLDGHRREDPKP